MNQARRQSGNEVTVTRQQEQRACIAKTGEPCFWAGQDLCSACASSPKRTDRERIIDRIVGAAQMMDAWDVPGPGGDSFPLVLVRRDRYCELTAAVIELLESDA